MADFESCRRFLNPCLLHLQKMGLELKCPICLSLLSHPTLLPCNHIFCRSCISGQLEFGLKCLVCKLPFASKDLRPAPCMETMVCIYKSMDAAFGANLFQPASEINPSDAEEPSMYCAVSGNPHQPQNEVESPESPVKASKSINDRESADYVGSGNQNCKYSAYKEAFVNEGDPSPSLCLLLRNRKGKEQEIHETDFPHLAQASPGSPPSFGDIKDSDDDSNDQASDPLYLQSEGRLSLGLSKKEPQDVANPEAEAVLSCSPFTNPSITTLEVSRKRNPSSSSEGDQTRESKRQKSDCGLHDMPSNSPDYMNTNPATVCAFCQASKISQASGPILHYFNGTAVESEEAIQSTALHVHKQCVEWAPQVYFVGETVMNLEAEVARGLKIKCSRCGKKGATLGCYAKSCRRSFHVPCAVDIPECRWDCDNFLMLCPTHSFLKLPNERSKSKKKKGSNKFSTARLAYPQTSGDLPSSKIQKPAQLWTASPDETSEWVLCGSALSSAEKDLLSEFASLTGVTVSKVWNPNVTHIIASTDEIGACSRTLKFLMAILSGRWILKIDWIKACMEAKRPVFEEPYEISCDVHGSSAGPKNGRIRVIEKAPKLFSGLNFYFNGDFMPSYKGYLQDLVVAAGGNVLVKKDMVPHNPTAVANPSTTVVMYNQDPPQESKSRQPSSVEQRLKEAEAIAAKTGSQVVGHAWLLDSVAACMLQPISS